MRKNWIKFFGGGYWDKQYDKKDLFFENLRYIFLTSVIASVKVCNWEGKADLWAQLGYFKIDLLILSR